MNVNAMRSACALKKPALYPGRREVLSRTMSVASKDMDALSHLRAVNEGDLYPHGMVTCSPAPKRMLATISRLGPVRIVDFEASRYVKPESIYYELDGKSRRWCVLIIPVVKIHERI